MKKITLSLLSLLLFFVMIVSIDQPIIIQAEEQIKGLNADNYIVIDENGFVLLENNADEKREVASICKLMTTLLTLEKIERGEITLNDKFTASDYACRAEGSQAFLDSGCEYSVSDLLKSVIVASANDSAIVLAENLAGSEENFVEQMNKRAEALGMINTLYGNSTGLSGHEQYSTARDTAIILNEVSDYDIYNNFCRIWMDTLTHPSGRETELVNTNRLIRYYDYCKTGKTGFTDEAGYCLSSTAEKNNLKLTCVVLGCDSASDRFTDSVYLYNYAYANFENAKILDVNAEVPVQIKVSGGKEKLLELRYKEDFYLTQTRNSDKNYSIEYNLVDIIKAPISEWDQVGVAKIIVDGETIGEVDVVAKENIEKQSFKDVIGKIIDKYGFIN